MYNGWDGLGQSPTQNLAHGPLFLSGPSQPGPVVARGNILLARMAKFRKLTP